MATFAYDVKIDRVQRTLRRLEEDVPLLAMRVKELSAERQILAKNFASSMIEQVRAELDRLMEERGQEERKHRASLRTRRLERSRDSREGRRGRRGPNDRG